MEMARLPRQHPLSLVAWAILIPGAGLAIEDDQRAVVADPRRCRHGGGLVQVVDQQSRHSCR